MSTCPDEIHGGEFRWVCVGHTSTNACIRKPFPLHAPDSDPEPDN